MIDEKGLDARDPSAPPAWNETIADLIAEDEKEGNRNLQASGSRPGGGSGNSGASGDGSAPGADADGGNGGNIGGGG